MPANCPADVTVVIEMSTACHQDSPYDTAIIPKVNETDRYPSAIGIPEMKKSRAVVFVVLLALVLSCMFYYIPFLSRISSGITITVVAIVAAVIGSLLFPVADDTDKE